MGFFEIFLILVLATVPALFFRRLGIETHGPFCLWRTKKGLSLLDKLSEPKNFWKAMASAGVVFAFGVFGIAYIYKISKKTIRDKLKILVIYAIFSASSLIIAMPVVFSKGIIAFFDLAAVLLIGGVGSFVVYALLLNTFNIINQYVVGTVPLPGIAPIIPGVEIEGSPLSFPFHAIVGLVVLLVVHELAHGILARIEKIKVKSLGILTSGIFPIGAFAEPDEKQLKKAEIQKRLKVYAAGSMSNFMTGTIFMLLFLGMMATMQPRFIQDPLSSYPAYIPYEKPYIDHLLVVYSENGSAAQKAGIVNGTKIYDIDLIFRQKTPNTIEIINTSLGMIQLQRNATGYFGFEYTIVKNYTAYTTNMWVKKYSLEIIFWIFALNFIVGVVNFMPFIAFDGAHIFSDILASLTKVSRKKAEKIVIWVSYFILLLLILNAMPYFIGKF
jgi:membrane-associated protease RseP (regulator of RpoE activity)